MAKSLIPGWYCAQLVHEDLNIWVSVEISNDLEEPLRSQLRHDRVPEFLPGASGFNSSPM